MVKNFYSDLAKAKLGENIVRQVLQGCQDEYEIYDVSEDKEYWHKGDIEIYDVEEHISYYLDVKDDSRIHQTGNLLAEHRVWYAKGGWCEGFMQNSDYDYIGYLSQPDKMIYILDFRMWQKYYLTKSQRHLQIPHGGAQTTDGYLMSLDTARKLGIVIAEIKYEEYEKDCFVPLEVIKRRIYY